MKLGLFIDFENIITINTCSYVRNLNIWQLQSDLHLIIIGALSECPEYSYSPAEGALKAITGHQPDDP